MKCIRCGFDSPDEAKFCLECGTSLADPLAQTSIIEEDEGVVLLRALQRHLTGQYEVEREIGRGAMAIVYKAVEVELNRRVALKVLPPGSTIGRGMAERFKREARLAASLDHPNIIPVHRVGQAGSALYIAMKFIEGRALDEMIETQGPLPIPAAILILRAATAALAFAHAQGIVHRDVKGANIMVDRDGRVMVADFGIARATDDASLTSTGSVVGTPYFMSPEQCAARRIGPQSDQYSLGVVAFQMLTGLVPFNAETLPGIMHHHFYTPVPDVKKARPDIPPALLEVVNRALSKKPENRYATTEAMLAAIEAIPLSSAERADGEDALRRLARGAALGAVHARPLPPLGDPTRDTPTQPLPVWRRIPPKRRMTAGAAAGVAVATALIAWLVGATRGSPPAGATPPQSVVGAPVATATALAGARPDKELAPAPAAGVRRDVALGDSGRDSVRIAPAPGLVRLRAYPVDAEISVGGQILGRGVVLDASVPAGRHRLTVRAPGYVSFDTTITILPGETTQLRRIELATGQ
ncbi:MAG TPA: protein kinase [Gemmatimonadaceae bacterium]|nr:protein kinase [Gemmatimonadaceae bacterium]